MNAYLRLRSSLRRKVQKNRNDDIRRLMLMNLKYLAEDAFCEIFQVRLRLRGVFHGDIGIARSMKQKRLFLYLKDFCL